MRFYAIAEDGTILGWCEAADKAEATSFLGISHDWHDITQWPDPDKLDAWEANR